MENNLEKCVYLCVCLNHFAVHLKLLLQCKSIILQYEKKKRKNIQHIVVNTFFTSTALPLISFCYLNIYSQTRIPKRAF